MRTLRRLARDRLHGGLLAIVVCYALLLQGVAGGYAALAMASGQEGSGPVICSPGGTTTADAPADPDDPLRTAGAHACCDLLCQVACASGIFLPASDLGPAFARPADVAPRAPTAQLPARGGTPERPNEARAPPAFSV